MNEQDLKKALAKLLEEAKEKRRLDDIARKEKNEADRMSIFAAVTRDLGNAIAPYMNALKDHTDSVVRGIKDAGAPKIEVKVPPITIPTIVVPPVKVPTPQVNFDLSKIKVPDIKMPDEMNVKGWLGLQGYDRSLLNNPIPVQLRDADGNPVKLFENLTSLSMGGGGGGGNFPMQVLDVSNNALRVSGSFSVTASNSSTHIIDASNNIVGSASNPLNVSLVGGSASSTYAQVGNSDGDFSIANPLAVRISGAAASTYAEIMNPDGRVKVELPTGSSGLTDTELRASRLDVIQVSGSNWSVFATNPVDNGDAATALRVVVAGNSAASVTATQTGTWNIGTVTTVTTVTGVTNSVAAALVDSSGVQYSTSNPLPIDDAGGSLTVDGTVAVSGVTGTVATNLSDSSGVGYSGSNPLPITLVSGALTSTIVVGPTNDGGTDDGSAPLKVGGIARTTNPTAHGDGQSSALSLDSLGRQITRPVQMRGLIATAYASIATGTETTLLAAGGAGVFHDMIFVQFSNNSTAAVGVDIREVTGGNVVMHYEVPANGVVGGALPVPWPQSSANNNWTADLPDITGTTVTVTGLFSKEV